MAAITINTDGGARGNPGPAAAGAVIRDGDITIAQVSSYLGERTNNWAEYEALIRGIEAAKEALGERLGEEPVEIRMDSELIVKQMRGEYKVKDAALRDQHMRVRTLLESIPNATFVHVPRAQNAEADALVNEALDAALL
ncbi:MAG TPA: ribonuclease HI family protein [Candidatus Paceibacterota bacterium]|nr:ribonuclease HI family protein [Candidatus Paceibacterota bacterium]